MHNAGLATIVINADKIADARKARKNIWEEARAKITMVLVSPEELKSSEFSTLLDNETFSGRVYAMGVDEVHLLYFWGADFRPRFRQIGFVRARLPGHNGARIVLVALTATLRDVRGKCWQRVAMYI
jgi:superfamily II DNA helicase RecQ